MQQHNAKYPLTRQLVSFEAIKAISMAHTQASTKANRLAGEYRSRFTQKVSDTFLVSLHSGSLYFSKIDKLEIRSHRDVSLLRVWHFILYSIKRLRGPLAQMSLGIAQDSENITKAILPISDLESRKNQEIKAREHMNKKAIKQIYSQTRFFPRDWWVF